MGRNSNITVKEKNAPKQNVGICTETRRLADFVITKHRQKLDLLDYPRIKRRLKRTGPFEL